MRARLAGLAFAALLAVPRPARAEAPRSPAPLAAPIVTGAILLGVPYVASNAVGVVYSVSRNVFCSVDGDVELRALAGASTPTCPNRGYGWLTVPIAGPFVALAGYPQDTLPAALLVTSGALQVAGATLLTVGIVRSERARTRRSGLTLVPGAPGSTVGLSLVATGS